MSTAARNGARQQHDLQAVEDGLRLFMEPGQVTELRALGAVTAGYRQPHTEAGYFDDPAKLAQAVGGIKQAMGIYFIPNPVNPALLARAVNKIRPAPKGESTQDGDIVRRRRLLIDTDPVRPSGIASTDAEHQAALESTQEIAADLAARGWPDGISADSGNGGHLDYLIDVEADDGGLVQRCLQALAAQHDDKAVKVDQTVFNPARIWKLYGTVAGKGDAEAAAIGRPHRLARILSAPDKLVAVPRELLEALAAEAPSPAKASPSASRQATAGGGAFDLAGWIRTHGLDVEGPEDWRSKDGQVGQRWVFDVCPWNADHTNRSAFILQFASGAIDAGCRHNGCSSRNWHDLRELYEPGFRERGIKGGANAGATAQPAEERTGPGGIRLADVLGEVRARLRKLPPLSQREYEPLDVTGRRRDVVHVLAIGYGLADADAVPLLLKWDPDTTDGEYRDLLAKVRAADQMPTGYLLMGIGTDDAAHEQAESAAAGAATPEWEEEAPTARKAPPLRFDLIDSATFARSEYPLEWHVRRLLVKGQGSVLGGPKKVLKTTLLQDLAISLGTGTAFLDEFVVPRPVCVAFLSGESGQATLKDTALRVCAAKGVRLEDADVLWGFRLPQLAAPGHLTALATALRDHGAGVVILDPLYLCLLAGSGSQGPQAANLYQMGPLLLDVTQACLEVGCTPILAHHFKLTRPDHYAEPQLEDLAFAGIQEFARQWVLVGRRERYEAGSGLHRLWLSVGGSAGHSGLWSVDVDEGAIDEDFRGRWWQVTVHTATEARQSTKNQREQTKTEALRAQDRDDDSALLAALDNLDPLHTGAGANQVQQAARLSDARMLRAALRLKGTGIIEDRLVTVNIGTGYKTQRDVKGIRRAREGGG